MCTPYPGGRSAAPDGLGVSLPLGICLITPKKKNGFIFFHGGTACTMTRDKKSKPRELTYFLSWKSLSSAVRPERGGAAGCPFICQEDKRTRPAEAERKGKITWKSMSAVVPSEGAQLRAVIPMLDGLFPLRLSIGLLPEKRCNFFLLFYVLQRRSKPSPRRFQAGEWKS